MPHVVDKVEAGKKLSARDEENYRNYLENDTYDGDEYVLELFIKNKGGLSPEAARVIALWEPDGPATIYIEFDYLNQKAVSHLASWKAKKFGYGRLQLVCNELSKDCVDALATSVSELTLKREALPKGKTKEMFPRHKVDRVDTDDEWLWLKPIKAKGKR